MKTTKSYSDAGRFDFMKMAPAMGIFSAATMVLAFFFIFTKGFYYGIDFEGGTEILVKFQQEPDVAKIRQVIESVSGSDSSVQSFGEDNEVLIRMQQARGANNQETNRLNQERVAKVTEALRSEAAMPEDGIQRVDTVGPQVGNELKQQAILAIIYSLIVLAAYIGLQFDFRYVPALLICLVHDTIVLLGIYSMLGREINIQVLAGVLTLIGYSINDTIVIYDAMRGNEPLYKEKGMTFIINRSVNEMLVRSLITGGTTLVCSICLYIFATGAIEDIALTMILGIIIGTFSSIYVAAPLVPITDRLIKKWS